MPDREPTIAPAFTGAADSRSACAARGFCGPFRNEEHYLRLGGILAGQGDCAQCGAVRRVAIELEKWERSLWRDRFDIHVT